MIKDLISLIIPTFNRYEFVLERLEEIKNQTYKNWELIIVNDGSTDKTNTLTETNKIKIINLKQNSGTVTIPRNIGITHSNGEFIAHIDDDVINMNDKLENLVTEIKKDQYYSMVYGDRITVHQNGMEEHNTLSNWNPQLGPGIDNSQILYRSKFYKYIPLIFCTRACDWELSKYLALYGKIGYTNNIVSKYIWHTNNRSLNPKTKFTPINIDLYKEYFKPGYTFAIV